MTYIYFHFTRKTGGEGVDTENGRGLTFYWVVNGQWFHPNGLIYVLRINLSLKSICSLLQYHSNAGFITYIKVHDLDR